MNFDIGLKDIQQAQKTLSKFLAPTPLLKNEWLSEKYGCEVYLKLENMQPIGSFKIRGATYKITSLSDAEKKKGVIAASAGNHSQGVAWGSRRLGVHAQIVMPEGAPITKVRKTKSLGAEITLTGENFDDAYAHAKEISEKTGRVLIHAFRDPHVIAGQGVVGLEVLDQLPDVDCIVGSIGGGGMLGGLSIAAKELKEDVHIVGAQATGAPSMVESIRQGRICESESVSTFADGIMVKRPSDEMYEILKPRLDKVCDVLEDEISAAVLAFLEQGQMVAEGAAGVALAAFEQVHHEYKNKKVVLVVSGGNIDVNLLGRIIDRGLVRTGRKLRLNLRLSDRPGSLSKLTEVIAQKGASVLQVIHDRNEPATQLDQTAVAATLETRGSEHSREVMDAIHEYARQWHWHVDELKPYS